jgi:hypothetical protein
MKQAQSKLLIYILCGTTILALVGVIISLVFMNNLSKSYEDKFNLLAQEVRSQKTQKEQIRGIYEQQAVQNDKLIIAQQNYTSQVEEYVNEMKRTFRFINGIPEFLATNNEARIKDKNDLVKQEYDNLNTKTEENAKLKKKLNEEIQNIYLQAGEDQSNRANPDGIR